ncbi:MAG: protein-L-isoaspartate(D-aspartate) O-methyltransferase [Anaerolineae bacterium]
MPGKSFDPDLARSEMVSRQLAARGISDARVLQAMAEIPRHLFVPEKLQSSAYKDKPLPIGQQQTISQPYMVAYMTQALALPADGSGVVLEIGTGSGYQAAVLSRLAARVFSVERLAPLAAQAERVLRQLGITNVEIKVGDGGYGWPEQAPFDGIIVTAAAPQIPPPLTAQLKTGAKLLTPVGSMFHQELLCLERQDESWVKRSLVPVAFVPLRGEHGWQSGDQ